MKAFTRAIPFLAAFAKRSFLVRVVCIAAVLAIPVLGTGFSMVHRISDDIGVARSEQVSMTHIRRLNAAFIALERFRHCIGERKAGPIHRASTAADRAFTNFAAAYGHHGVAHERDPFWIRFESRWAAAKQRPSIATLDLVYAALRDAGNLEQGTALYLDPSSAVQNVSDSVMLRIPRAIVALRRTEDAVAGAPRPLLDAAAIKRIAALRAGQDQSIADDFSNFDSALELDPSLRAPLASLVASTKSATKRAQRGVDALLISLRQDGHGDATGVAAAQAVDAHFALWQAGDAEVVRLVAQHLDRLLLLRRTTVAFTLFAVLASALAVAFVSRYEARRDKIELAAAILEGAKLRAELATLSVERALRLQEAQFRTVFENADLGIVMFDAAGNVARLNIAAAELLGANAQALLNAQRDIILRFRAITSAPIIHEAYRLTEEGRAQWLSLTFTGVYDEGDCQMVIGLIRDATEERAMAQTLTYEANHDSLTGLANRAAFDKELGRLFSTQRRDAMFALMYIDLDRFKPINDSHGHRAGDHVLVTVAERLRSALSSDDLCARIGGDEFAVIVAGVDAPAVLETIARRICTSIAKPMLYDGGCTFAVTASIGIAMRSYGTASPDHLKIAADQALYAVKARGRDGYLLHQPQPVSVSAAAGPTDAA